MVSCQGHRDSVPLIHVDPRAAQRLNLLGGPAERARTPRAASRVHAMVRGEELGGPNAIGRPGDLVLENEEVVFVIDQLGYGSGFAESGGNIADAADARVRKDELGQLLTYFGKFPRQGVYDALSSGESPDGTAWVEARGHELYEPSVSVATRYALRPPDRAVSIETTVENEGNAGVELPSIGDALEWGGAERFAPGKPRGFVGESTGPYVGAVGRFTSYALTSTEGSIQATSGGFWTDTSQRKAVKLAPHGKASYSRVFLVGERPDSASLVGELALLAGQPVGRVHVKPSGEQSLPTGATLGLIPDGSEEAITLAAPFVAWLPVGRYRAAFVSGNVRDASRSAPVDVASETEVDVDLPTEPSADLDVRCKAAASGASRDPRSGAPCPCKVTLQGLAGTHDPDFGPVNVAGPARNQATTADGRVGLRLAAGRYRVTASRGPEYSLASVDLDVTAGAHKSLELELSRVVDTTGYVACDFHQHTILSADAAVATRDRVIANVAEGVEVAVATEHNVVADLSPIVRELGLQGELVAIAGDELTSDASRHPWGHANVFPLPLDPGASRGGAPVVRDRTPREVFGALRASASNAANAANAQRELVIQVNHPRSALNGYFDLLGFDRARGVGIDPAYDAAFDALEVWNGRNTEARATIVDDFRALLRTGHVVTATANTDTHGIVGQEAGYPRTYVRVTQDGDFASWDPSRTAELVRGVKVLRDVVLTNGPMLRLTANGVSIGGLARGHSVSVKVHVEAAPWVSVDKVKLMRANGSGGAGAAAGATKAAEQSVTLSVLPSGARGGDVSFQERFDADDAFFVVASGSAPLSPVLAGDERDILPWAMTGAIWVDADGDGRSLGRGQ